MKTVVLRHEVRKGDFHLNVDTAVPAKGVTGIFGESGAGKTTLLRCIAGLESSSADTGLPVHKRRIGYVFQEPLLFAHLTVRKNIEYGLRRNPASRVTVDAVSELLEIEALLDRFPSALSGGEAQRVAIARVLCQSPELILMDEPLSALDARRREEVLPHLDRLHADTAVPIIYVSHNIDEIARLSDHLLVLDEGEVVANDNLQAVLARTDLRQLGGRNAGAVIETTLDRFDEKFGLSVFRFSGGEISVPGRHDATSMRLRIQASDISVNRERARSSTILNILPATIQSRTDESEATTLLQLAVGDDILIARITRRSEHDLQLAVGDSVYAQIKSVTVRR